MLHEGLLKGVEDSFSALKALLKEEELSDNQSIELSSTLMDVVEKLWQARCQLRVSLANDRD